MADTESIFTRIDSMDPSYFAELFAQDATLTFGNGEPMVGRDAIATGSAIFFTTIAGLRHRIINQWFAEHDTIAETAVTYTRHDGREVTVPAVSIWSAAANGLIRDYRIFADLTPVFGS
ncbi:hypothetical protein A5724_12715 [Mycobacterium sp. ACS1612]|uniref:nuclear transport factor 2 family protein n=1 Tax=Mycobacterium sp. ACS1612 TaxID=1834117 RepID=UPI000801A60B|nr:nuclear transport factor 2 family protein [Mycobacterium sp. ACS1612]OBF36725.1 hypothetical protein A5724_12715 [Mycobacterium sp. ACS1612]